MIGPDCNEFDEMVRLAEAALEQLRPAFEAELEHSAMMLAAAWERSKGGTNADGLAEIFRSAHELKGQAGSFGFDLLTDIAASLCKLVHRLKATEANTWRAPAIEVHIRSLVLVAKGKIRGDGGALGRQLLEQIAILSAKAT